VALLQHGGTAKAGHPFAYIGPLGARFVLDDGE